ncbi:hypothetical protein GGI12_000916 [Dipsacomyces acuminosporus]|nr:hypothetical protein GGI12_000916 [Dipsacomyces acuminosporus]
MMIVSSLRRAFIDQLHPLALNVSQLSSTQFANGGSGSGTGSNPGPNPTGNSSPLKSYDIPVGVQSGKSKSGGASGNPKSDATEKFVEKAFDVNTREDILNAIITGFVRRSHMLLYAEDPWSEGYSLRLLADVADKTGAHLSALDIPDWSVLTSRIDPILEDLTIVSHPYSPPPDLEASHSGESARGMSFFAGINRKRFNDEGDTLSEQVDHSAESSYNSGSQEDNGIDSEEGYNRDSATSGRPGDSEIDAIRAQFGLGKSPGIAEDDSGDPTLSREMMSNPLSRDATERLDRVLADFASAPTVVDGTERPRIIAIKHLGDLMNTRIGYTLFSRFISAVARHNSNADVQPVVVVGLLHPSWFHPDIPPPGIPPFDVNPSTPVALMPSDDRSSPIARGVGDIVEGLLGGDASNRLAGNRVGVHLVQMDGMPVGSRISKTLGSSAKGSANGTSVRTPDELPLFARVGIPPPAHKVLSTPCDMQAPELSSGSDQSQQQVVGSLRQSLVADQCLDRNARVIRNICLLYRIPGLELTSKEASYLASVTGDADMLEQSQSALQNVVFNRESLYRDDDDRILPKQPRKNTWHLDYRPLTVMLRSLPDDVARRYFFAETFLHRWISIAHALAIREKLSLESIKRKPVALAEATGDTFLASRHLNMAWVQLIKSHIALRQGMLALPHSSNDGDGGDGGKFAAIEPPESSAGEEVKAGGKASTSGSSRIPAHRLVDYSEIGIGRMAEDDMDVSPALPIVESSKAIGSRKGQSTTENTGLGRTIAKESIEEPGQADAQLDKPADFSGYIAWADVSRKLEPSEEDLGEEEGKSTKLSAIPTPKRRIQLAKKNLTEYEQRLMGSVVDPESIPTGFSQVCAKPETIATLQEVITLPMLRPEYFSRGVLKRHSISGILLFGPPGTGKTMLAKAVAKESGSIVLNIRASDVYDKYVGEGEKLAEAVFTLARKLAPCVIFIDEVDALFAARSSGETNKFRRDILNQIMSEWDGMNTSRAGKGDGAGKKAGSQSQVPSPQVMVMAATNRPFDLDDAILRRLPRRILIDLPGAVDRAKILDIHLAGEELDSDVDLKALAERTESFSGSDLKNLCVAAALAALRERIRKEVSACKGSGADGDRTSNGSGDTISTVPDISLIEQLKNLRQSPSASASAQKASAIKLAMRHFDAALKKVAPSSSDQMESLIELRKWDKMYGDSAQERKRKYSIGFTAPPPPSASSHSA